MEHFVEFEDVCKYYQTGSVKIAAADHLNFYVDKGEFCIIVGPSGAGKTTLLNILGGMDNCDEGNVWLDGRNVSRFSARELTTYRRYDVGFVFQFYNLVQNLTALENVELASEICRDPLDPAETLRSVGLGERLNNFPAQLSGGEQQRVSIARALVKMPRVLLLDEPLSNLDARLRLQTREEIRKIQRATKITTVFVTHDQEEAMSISDMIVVMKSGVVQQIGKPQDVYDSPVNLFVARFLGTPPINVFEGEIRGQKLYIGENAILDAPGISDQQVFAGIRPEGFVLDKNGPLCCQLGGVEVMGRDISVVSSHAASQAPAIRSIISSESSIDLSSKTIRFAVKPNKIFLFGRETEERIYL